LIKIDEQIAQMINQNIADFERDQMKRGASETTGTNIEASGITVNDGNFVQLVISSHSNQETMQSLRDALVQGDVKIISEMPKSRSRKKLSRTNRL
jgi:hypothetical protein